MSQYDEEDPPIEEPAAQVGTGPWGDAALAASASLLGGMVPPAAPYIAGGVVLLRDLGKRVSGHIAKRDELLLDSGSRASGLDPAILIDRLLGDEELTMLAASAIDASRRSRMPEKARMLGRCLGAIAADDARIDEEALWVGLSARTSKSPHCLSVTAADSEQASRCLSYCRRRVLRQSVKQRALGPSLCH